MKFFTVKSIWDRLKTYLNPKTFFLLDRSPQIELPSSPTPTTPFQRKTKRRKKYCFKDFDSEEECVEEKTCNRKPKTKKIQKSKKCKQSYRTKHDPFESLKYIPEFVDENGVQVSSIGKKSEIDESFDVAVLKQMINNEFKDEPIQSKLVNMKKKNFYVFESQCVRLS